MRYLVALLTLLALPTSADCICACVGGVNQPLCDSSLDIPRICGPKVCPVVPPRVKPIDPIMVPPVGTRRCSRELVLVDYVYEWQVVCR